MTQISSSPSAGPHGSVVPVKAQPNVYTVLLAVAAVALCVTIAVVLWRLTSSTPAGYGVPFKEVFTGVPAGR